jgi:protocatechuate 3,4-dioxygenase beta subunit
MNHSRRDFGGYLPTRRRLLRDLTGAGVGAVGVGLIARRVSMEEADAAAPSCVLSPEVTEGPYYLDLNRVRRDITEGKAGLRLDLRIKVVDASSCRAIEDAAVDIWHADAGGTYSGFSAEGTDGRTFLRGVQLTGEDGVARFRTIYPGWYTGRAIHIHLKTHVGGRTVHTGQLFFSDRVSDHVATLSPYNARGGDRTRNSADDIYRQAGAGALLRLRRRRASTIRKGLVGAITVGVDRS